MPVAPPPTYPPSPYYANPAEIILSRVDFREATVAECLQFFRKIDLQCRRAEPFMQHDDGRRILRRGPKHPVFEIGFADAQPHWPKSKRVPFGKLRAESMMSGIPVASVSCNATGMLWLLFLRVLHQRNTTGIAFELI